MHSKDISISNGLPTVALPLIGVLCMTAVKDAIEDYAKHVADAIENGRTTARLDSNTIATPTTVSSAEVRVSDIIMVKNREFIPADMVLLASSEGQDCHVMTANLGATIITLRCVDESTRATLNWTPRLYVRRWGD